MSKNSNRSMAQASNPKIEELRFRLRTDPRTRLFFPLAEELRKIGQLHEAETVLRTGLSNHPAYLSAWVCLGRVLRDENKNGEAAETLSKALQLDPGNVVAARLLAETYDAMGDKLEAIKKYKLVRALLPRDQEIDARIEQLDRELNPPRVSEPEPEPFVAVEESPFAEAEQAIEEEQRIEAATGDDVPMSAAHSDSPFEEPAADLGYSADALAVEQPEGIHVARTPLAAEMPMPWEEEPLAPSEAAPPIEYEADIFAPDEPTNTLTMAELYERQGLHDEARQIYENILQRDPENAAVRAKLEDVGRALSPPAGGAESPSHVKVEKLKGWLTKVGGRV
jgi:tetratricopeptide (TPR) repeat protein